LAVPPSDCWRKIAIKRSKPTAEEKVAILRRHLLDQVPVSVLCEEKGLQPTVFYRWQKELFENGASAFQAKERPARQVEEKQKWIEFLEKKVQTKDEVLAELMAEHMALKRSLGVAAMLAGSLAGESPAGGSLPSYPRSDIRRRRG
jgi:transposase-like protein